MADVFLSYSREDEETASALACTLSDRFSVFFDKSIRAGERWTKRLEDEIEAASCIVVIWSPASKQSHWVREEAQLALDKQAICPIIIRGCNPPFGFRTIHAINFSGWKQSETSSSRWVGLVSSIESLIGSVPQAQEAVKSGQLDDQGEFQPLYDRILITRVHDALDALQVGLKRTPQIDLKYEESGSKRRLAVYLGHRKICTALAQRYWMNWYFRKPALELGLRTENLFKLLPSATINNSGEVTVKIGSRDTAEKVVDILAAALDE